MNIEQTIQATKMCSKCRSVQPEAEFFRDRSRKDGFSPQCKQCHRDTRKKRDPSYGTSERGKGLWLAKDGVKRCGKCHETRAVSEFHKNKVQPDGLQHYCKECQKMAARLTDQRHPESKKRRMRKTYLKRRYSLTPEQYDLMVLEQNNKCAICHEEMLMPHIDHDHSCCPGQDTCGKCVRALLCSDCNLVLGKFNDNTERFLRAVSYLDSYKERSRLLGGSSEVELEELELG